MKKRFTGVWATFEFLDDTCSSIQSLKESGFNKLTTHTPCPRHEIDHALGDPQSRVPFATLTGAFFGFGVAVLVVVWMTLDWILPVSAKPVVSVPIMGPIAFEFSVLMSIYFTIGAMILLIAKDTFAHPVPKSKKYRQYNRFLRDRFGVVVLCGADDIPKVEGILKKHQAEEVNLED